MKAKHERQVSLIVIPTQWPPWRVPTNRMSHSVNKHSPLANSSTLTDTDKERYHNTHHEYECLDIICW